MRLDAKVMIREFGFDFGGEETLPTKPKPTINILFPNVDKENLPKKSYNMSLSKQLWDSETDSYAPLAISNMPFPRLQPGPPAGGGGLLPAAGASTGAVIPTGLFGQGPPLAVGGQAHFGSLHRVAPAPPAAPQRLLSKALFQNGDKMLVNLDDVEPIVRPK